MKKRSVPKMGTVIIASVVLCFLFYELLGMTGYLTLADKTLGDNVLNSYPEGDIPVAIGKIFIAIVLVFSYPLLHFACREAIQNIFFPNKPFSWIRWLGIMLVIITGTTLLGLFLPSILTVFGLFMTTSGVLVMFVFPSIIYIKLETSWMKRIPAILLTIVSIILGAVAFVATVIDMIESFKGAPGSGSS